MASSADWIFGQKLVALGVCPLAEIRDALAEADRDKRPLADVLRDRGVPVGKLREAGAQVADRPAAPARRPLPEIRPSRVPWAIAIAALLGVGVWLATRPPAESNVVDADPDRAPREELEKLAAAEDLEKAPEVVRAYEGYGKRWAGLKWELRAHEKLQVFRAKADVPARAALEELAPKEVELLAAGRIGDALRLYLAYPAKFLVTEAGSAAKAKILELSQKARAAFVKGKAEAEKLLADGKFKAAEDKAGALAAVAPAEAAGEIEDLKVRIDREARGARGKARQEVADKYLEIDGKVKAHLTRRPPSPRGAAREILAFVTAPWDETRRPFARAEGVDYDAVKKAVEDWNPEALRAAAEAALPDPESPDRLSTGEAAILDFRAAALVELFYRDAQAAMRKAVESGEAMNLPGLGKGRFEKQGETTVFVREGAGIVEASAVPLSDEDLEALAARESGAEADLRAGFFYFQCSPGREVKAYDRLEKARQAGARGVRVYLTGLYLARQVDLAKSLRTKFEAAEDVFGKRQWPATRKLLGEMLEHPEHPFVKEKRPLIEKMLFEIADGSDAERRLSARLKGKATILPDGRARIVYDFESPEQADGFEPPGEDEARAFPGRWKVVEGGLESSAREASVLRWKTPLKGDVEVAYDLTPIAEPQNVTAALYARKGGPGHYAVVLGFDWVGRGEGDRDNSAEDRRGMPRACVIKYPVKADKLRWREADEWLRWHERLVGERTSKEPLKPVLGKTLRLTIQRTGSRLRVLADGEEYWSGEDAEYAEGSLVFFADSRCRLEALVITGAFAD
ncbi:MAG TPA: hypothetical protein VF950_02485 [Planctomycetota bacterium]